MYYCEHISALLRTYYLEKLIESNEHHWLTKRNELHFQTTLHLSSKNFRLLLKTLELSGVCFGQQSLRPLLTVVDVSVLEGRRVAKKELLGETKKLKKLFVPRKVTFKAWLAAKSSLELRSQYSEARKAAARST